MDEESIRQRLKKLQAEIAILQKEDRSYRFRRHFPQEIQAHEQRVIRMKQVLDELASLMKK